MRYRSTLFTAINSESPKVSFCQIHDTNYSVNLEVLANNLSSLQMDSGDTEYLLLIPNEAKYQKTIVEKFEEQISTGFLKVASYHNAPSNRLKNLALCLAKGLIVMHLLPNDHLPPRLTTYVFNELMTEAERAIVFEKRKRQPQRLALLRSTFFEIGGFDESIDIQKQIYDLILRIKLFGVNVEIRPHDHFTKGEIKRKRNLAIFKKPPSTNPILVLPHKDEYTWLG